MQQFVVPNQDNPELISIKDLRSNLASVLDRVALRGETFMVTKFGISRATIKPVASVSSASESKLKKSLKQSFGAWKRNVSAQTLSQQIRARAERRNETVPA